MCLGVFLLGFDVFGTLRTSWICMSISFTRLGKFSFIIFSNKFSISCSSSSPFGTPMIQMLECLKLCQKFLSLSSFFLNSCFFILFWLNVSFFVLLQIADLSHSFLPFTVDPLYIFLYFTLYSLHSYFILQLYSFISVSILITSVLNSASDRLAVSSLLSSFSGGF